MPMKYQQLYNKIYFQLRWKYFFSLDAEEVRDCVSDAVLAYLKQNSLGQANILDPAGYIYKVAERKILKKMKGGQHQDIDENDSATEDSNPEIQLIEWKYWEFEETQIVTIKKGILYIRIQSDLSKKLFDLFMQYLTRNCLKVFLYMLIGWEDEDIQEEMGHKTLEVFRTIKGECMKQLRQKMKDEGKWDELFGRKWGNAFENKNKEAKEDIEEEKTE